MAEKAIKLGGKKQSTFIDKVKELLPEGGNLNLCLTCGACSSGCPATGLEGMDPASFCVWPPLGWTRRSPRPMGLDVQHVPAVHLRMPHEDQHSPAGLQCPQADPAREAPQGDHGVLRRRSAQRYLQRHGRLRRGLSSSWWKTSWRNTRNPSRNLPKCRPDVNRKGRLLFPEPELPRTGHRAGRNGAPVENPAPGGCRLDLRHQRLGGRKLLHVLGDNENWKHIVEVKVKAVEDLGCKVWLNTE
jgi:ferredoxin